MTPIASALARKYAAMGKGAQEISEACSKKGHAVTRSEAIDVIEQYEMALQNVRRLKQGG